MKKTDKKRTIPRSLNHSLRFYTAVSIGAISTAVLSAVCLLAFFATVLSNLSRARLAERIADEVLRFHVIANSDSDEDQALKLHVRDALITYMSQYSDSFTSAQDAAAFASSHCDELASIASSVISAEGFSYEVTAGVTYCDFPDKTYGSLTFPAGTYEALRIEIGAARGRNWWCVLYPPLCFTEEGSATVPDSSLEQLRGALSPEDFDRLQTSGNGVRPQIRFRLLDWLRGL